MTPAPNETEKKELEKQVATEEFFEQASQIVKKNAVVIRSADPTPAPKQSHKKTTDKRSNISFGQGQYKEKPKKHTQNTSHNTTPVPEKTIEKEPPKPKIIKEATVSDSLVKKDSIVIKDVISVKEFSEKSGIPFPQILKFMLANKMMGGINTALDFDTVSLIALEFGVSVSREQQTLDLDQVMS